MDVVAVGEVACDTCENIQSACTADGTEYNCCSAEVGVVFDFIEDGEHLSELVAGREILSVSPTF